MQLIATIEIEVRDTVWQVPDIACVPVFRCIVMSGGGGGGGVPRVLDARLKGGAGAKKSPVKVLRARRWSLTYEIL